MGGEWGSFKPLKSKSSILRIVPWPVPFVSRSHLDTISDKKNPVKRTGMLLTSDLKDTAACQATRENLSFLLWKSLGLPVKFKTWIYQHRILPIPFSQSEPCRKLKGRSVSSCTGGWVLSWSQRSIALYGHNTKLQLPFCSMAEVFMVTRATALLCQDFASKASSAGV